MTMTTKKILPNSKEEKLLIQKYTTSNLSMLEFAKQNNLKRGIIERIVKRYNLNIVFQKGKQSKTRINYKQGEKLFTKNGDETDFTYIDRRSISKDNKVRSELYVKCSCGLEKWISLYSLRSGNTKSCGYSTNHPEKDKKNILTSYKGLFYSYKRHAKERNLVFDLQLLDFIKILSQNCIYCGKVPSQLYQILNAKTKKIRSGIPVLYNGIDRVDNSKGYVIDNCVSCCKQCNRCKGKMTTIEYKNWIKSVYENLFNNITEKKTPVWMLKTQKIED